MRYKKLVSLVLVTLLAVGANIFAPTFAYADFPMEIDYMQPNKISDIFPDPNLAQGIASWMGLTVDDEITRDDIDALIYETGYENRIDLAGLGITDLTGMDIFKGISGISHTFIDLSENNITDESLLPLQEIEYLGRISLSYQQNLGTINNLKIKGLKWLSLVGNNIEDISPLGDAIYYYRLEFLDVSMNKITDLSPLANLLSLWTLGADHNPIKDLSGISNLVQLRELALYNTGITSEDLHQITDLTNLSSLKLGGNKIDDISFIENFPNLTTLNLEWCQIKDISPLASLQKLNEVDLQGNFITTVVPLHHLVSAKYKAITISDNFIDVFDQNEKAILDELTNTITEGYRWVNVFPQYSLTAFDMDLGETGDRPVLIYINRYNDYENEDGYLIMGAPPLEYVRENTRVYSSDEEVFTLTSDSASTGEAWTITTGGGTAKLHAEIRNHPCPNRFTSYTCNVTAPHTVGNILVQYQNENGENIEIDRLKNLPFGKHSITAKDIEGYRLRDNQPKIIIVELSEKEPNAIITFMYQREAVPPPARGGNDNKENINNENTNNETEDTIVEVPEIDFGDIVGNVYLLNGVEKVNQSGVEVLLFDADGNQISQTVSSEAGFIFEDLPLGEYKVKAELNDSLINNAVYFVSNNVQEAILSESAKRAYAEFVLKVPDVEARLPETGDDGILKDITILIGLFIALKYFFFRKKR